jgi:hypothetical protein
LKAHFASKAEPLDLKQLHNDRLEYYFDLQTNYMDSFAFVNSFDVKIF